MPLGAICYNEGVDDERQPVPRSHAAPTTGHVDELLVDPPAVPAGGSFAGYRAGRWTRFVFGFVILAAIAGAIVTYRFVRARQDAERNAPVIPSYALAEGENVTVRPRQLVWSSGPARLGLAREPPGVEEIVLPDRRIRLADGCDHAQIKVDVVGDRTVSLKVVVGDIVQLPLESDPGSQPTPPATGR
jgi:hypothetical protein